jgi:hypothetical protein
MNLLRFDFFLTKIKSLVIDIKKRELDFLHSFLNISFLALWNLLGGFLDAFRNQEKR